MKDIEILILMHKKMKQKRTNIISHEEAVNEIKKAEEKKELTTLIVVSIAGIIAGVICSYIQ